jgi:hypothetical protein
MGLRVLAGWPSEDHPDLLKQFRSICRGRQVIAVGRLDETADRNQGIEAIVDGGTVGAPQRSSCRRERHIARMGHA